MIIETIYSPLLPNQTRFLTVLPAENLEDEIRSELKLVSLDDELISTYEALSYTWESQIFTHTITICGRWRVQELCGLTRFESIKVTCSSVATKYYT
jgi:hypothetical protein